MPARAAAARPDRGPRTRRRASSPRTPQGDEIGSQDLGRGHAARPRRCDRPTWSTSCASIGEGSQLVAVGHRVVHGGARLRAARCGSTPRGDRGARQADPAGAAAPAAQPDADRDRCPSCAPTCRRWPASTPRSIARSPRWRRRSRCRSESPTRACGATASTACRTSTSPACCRRLDPQGGGRPHASSRTWATAAACARWSAGRSVASTMGFTAVDGLPMGTRCGSLDPGVILYLMDELGMDARADRGPDLQAVRAARRVGPVERHARRCSPATSRAPGSRSICTATASGASWARSRPRRGRPDALVFTAGIGEHAPPIRERVCRDAAWLGVDARRRGQPGGRAPHQHGRQRDRGLGDPDQRGADDRPPHAAGAQSAAQRT